MSNIICSLAVGDVYENLIDSYLDSFEKSNTDAEVYIFVNNPKFLSYTKYKKTKFILLDDIPSLKNSKLYNKSYLFKIECILYVINNMDVDLACYVDIDSIFTDQFYNIFQNKVLNQPLLPIHEANPEYKGITDLMTEYNIKKTTYYLHSDVILFNKICKDFFQECLDFSISNINKLDHPFDEIVINLITWKNGYKDCIYLHDIIYHAFDCYLLGGLDLVIEHYKKTKLVMYDFIRVPYTFHGNKDMSVAKSMISKLYPSGT